MNYETFLQGKAQVAGNDGFEPVWMPDFLFDFQRSLVEWAVRKGRAAIFADCGLGKTPMQLVWAENVVRNTGGRVLVATPLAVSHQSAKEAEKFGIDAQVSRDGSIDSGIVLTNYERLHYFSPDQFAGMVCDESGILKHYAAATRQAITDFMKPLRYRLLCSATPAPNDYMELGNSSEALGQMSRVEMLSMFFKHDSGETQKWRLKRHGEQAFWQWLCSWARACRKPSDLGFQDEGFILPELHTEQHIVKRTAPLSGTLFVMPAETLSDQRQERRETLDSRCEKVASLINGQSTVAWCHLNAEGDRLESLIDGAVQVSGSDPDEAKEERFAAFASGEIQVMVTKPTIAGFGMNWQHCSHQTFFPSHSFEQWYQAIRRSWRFGQERPVKVDIVTSEGEANVIDNMIRKSEAADRMFSELVRHMHDELMPQESHIATQSESVPSWL